MSVISREDAIKALLSRLAETEEPTPPWIYATIKKCLNDLPSLPSAEPLVHDGFYLCDKKPEACPSWEKYGWTKCMNSYCDRTSRLDHAFELPDDGWIPCSDHPPKLNKYVLFSTKRWPYPTPDEDNRVYKGMRLKDPRSGEIMWFSYGPGHGASYRSRMSRRRTNMGLIIYILFLWIFSELNAPIWCYLLAWGSFILRFIAWTYEACPKEGA